MLHRNTGLGVQIRGLLYEGLYPIKTLLGENEIAPRDVLNAAQACDRVILLTTKDLQRLPGALVRDSGTEFVELSGEMADKVTTLVVQQADDVQSVDDLEPRTIVQLARHIVDAIAKA